METLKRRYRNRARRLARLADRGSALIVCLGFVLAVGIAVSHSTRYVPVTKQWVEAKLATPEEDISNLYGAASQATWRDVPGWFAGPWINRKVGYYRPLTSLLYFLEFRAFGSDFTAYNRVTWLMHGLNAGLLYLLTVSLFRDRRLLNSALGLIAVWFFATNFNSMWIGVFHSIGWWPAQNDVLSLTFGLLSLLLLDQHLVCGGRGWLVGSLAAFCCAVFSKEMGYAVAPAAIALNWHRKRKLNRETLAFAGLSLSFWVFRKLVVPNPWAQNYFSDWVMRKAIDFAGGPPYFLARSQVWWPVVAGGLIIAIVAAGLRFRAQVIVIVATAVVATAVCAHSIGEGGHWAQLLEGTGPSLVRAVVVYFSSFILFVRYRRVEPGLFSAAALAFVLTPILQFEGYHYKYWPGAFLGLADACYIACLLRFAQEVRVTGNWTVSSGSVGGPAEPEPSTDTSAAPEAIEMTETETTAASNRK
jgi:hypothetical protein